MGETSRADVGRLLDLTLAVLDKPQTLWRTVCGHLSEILGTRLTGCFEVRWPSGETRSQLLDEGRWTGQIPWSSTEVAVHPLVRSFVAGADLAPRTLDDVADEEWRGSAQHALAREHFAGSFAQVIIPLQRTGEVLHYVGGARTGRDFNDRERGYLERLQPLLIALERHTRELDRLQRDLALTREPPTPSRLSAAEPRLSTADVRLTARESVVLGLLVEGLSPMLIARRLAISVRTVVKHQENLYRKLDVRDRVNAVLVAQNLGLTPQSRVQEPRPQR